MAGKFVSERNLKFLLYEVFDIEALADYPVYRQHNRKTFDMVLAAALKLAKDLYRPLLEEMDRMPPELAGGQVKVHPSVRTILQEMGNSGWIAATFPLEFDGEQLPLTLAAAFRFAFSAANYSASAYPELTAGAAHLITAFGDAGLVKTYVPDMLAGRFQGTMALTEPQAGSSLTDIGTSAEPAEDGTYRLQGRKIFISAGDHDGVENVIHLLLAKIPGGPPGVKGISLFVVPKRCPGPDGQWIENGVTVSQIYHKLGYRGTPATELVIGEDAPCRGYLVGEPHKGLIYMFQMMNEARLGVGLGAAAIASAAYRAALDYSRLRCQGRGAEARDPAQPPVPIIEHPDVRRMLLFQRSVVEGSLGLLLQCHRYADMLRAAPAEERERWHLLLEVLTPVAKSYPSEMGILAVSQAMQCFGGYGYCEDFPVEQYYRDIRIHPIHEGTTGIQGMDLLGRKVVMQNGRALLLFIEEVKEAVRLAEAYPELESYAHQLDTAAAELGRVTNHLAGVYIERGVEFYLADATLYLELFGVIAVGWQWLLQALAVHRALGDKRSRAKTRFYLGKIQTFKYFFHYELPKTAGLVCRLKDREPVTVEMLPDFFS